MWHLLLIFTLQVRGSPMLMLSSLCFLNGILYLYLGQREYICKPLLEPVLPCIFINSISCKQMAPKNKSKFNHIWLSTRYGPPLWTQVIIWSKPISNRVHTRISIYLNDFVLKYYIIQNKSINHLIWSRHNSIIGIYFFYFFSFCYHMRGIVNYFTLKAIA